jgi:hypothetical protein
MEAEVRLQCRWAEAKTVSRQLGQAERVLSKYPVYIARTDDDVDRGMLKDTLEKAKTTVAELSPKLIDLLVQQEDDHEILSQTAQFGRPWSSIGDTADYGGLPAIEVAALRKLNRLLVENQTDQHALATTAISYGLSAVRCSAAARVDDANELIRIAKGNKWDAGLIAVGKLTDPEALRAIVLSNKLKVSVAAAIKLNDAHLLAKSALDRRQWYVDRGSAIKAVSDQSVLASVALEECELGTLFKGGYDFNEVRAAAARKLTDQAVLIGLVRSCDGMAADVAIAAVGNITDPGTLNEIITNGSRSESIRRAAKKRLSDLGTTA